MEFAPATTSFMALHVEDVAQARKDLEAKGVEVTDSLISQVKYKRSGAKGRKRRAMTGTIGSSLTGSNGLMAAHS